VSINSLRFALLNLLDQGVGGKVKRSRAIFLKGLVATALLLNVVAIPAANAISIPGKPLSPHLFQRGPDSLVFKWDPPVINPSTVVQYEIRQSSNAGETWFPGVTVSKETTKAEIKIENTFIFNEYQIRTVGADSSSEWVQITDGGWNPTQIATNGNITCVLQSQGLVACVNSSGAGLVVVEGFANATQIAVGTSGTSDELCAVLSGGLLVCSTLSNSPVHQEGISNAVQVSIGESFKCVVLADKSVQCWGKNNFGQLGNGSTDDSDTPTLVAGVDNAVSISSGFDSSCVVLTNSTVKCWGGMFNSSTPTLIQDAIDVSKVEVGMRHSCVLLLSDSVMFFGYNGFGQVGDGTTDNKTTFTLVKDLQDVQDITLSYLSSCALTHTGVLKCWGDNSAGELGIGSTTMQLIATPVVLPEKAIAIGSGPGDACAITTIGQVKCWGANQIILQRRDPLQDNQLPAPVLLPTEIGMTGRIQITQISAFDTHTCGVSLSQQILCWGQYDRVHASLNPWLVPNVSNAMQVSVGSGYTCALLDDTKVKCWGGNQAGQLGDGTTVKKIIPTYVSNLTGVKSVKAGDGITCALLLSGGIKCWGMNEFGQLGDGTYIDRKIPVSVKGISDATEISIGSKHSCALLQTKKVKCWGSNFSGSIGLGGDVAAESVPFLVEGMENVTQIQVSSTEPGFTCALLIDATVLCLGTNSGLPSGTAPLFSPTAVPELQGVVSISAGNSLCGIKPNGDIKCYGKFGNLKSEQKVFGPNNEAIGSYPLGKVQSISVGQWNVCAVELSGRVICHNDLDKSFMGPTVVLQPAFFRGLAIAPGPVNGLRLTSTQRGIELSWEKTNVEFISSWLPADKYRVEWSTDRFVWSQIEVTDISAVISNLTPSTTYFVKVTAHSQNGWGMPMDPAHIITLNENPPPVITKKPAPVLKITGISIRSKLNKVTWSPPLDNGSKITKYEFRWKLATSKKWNAWKSNSLKATVNINGWVKNKKYNFQVRASNLIGSSISSIFTITQRK
jgi:alpha-tubulin suppressor-like RCC1 family protein